MPWQTFAHENIKKILDLQLASGNVPHAYFFFGPEGVGKKTLALEFAGKILAQAESVPAPGGTLGSTLKFHPDFAILDRETEITTEQMQQFMEPLRFKPFRGAKKVAIINNAHLMNTQSSNALLKTLEEPSASTILILISAHKDLLPTIVSRCQAFSFNTLTVRQLKLFSREQKLQNTDESIALSFGKISELLVLSDKAAATGRHKDIDLFEILKKSGAAERLLAVGELAEREPRELQKLFTSWLLWQRQQLTAHPGQSGILSELVESLRQLTTNKNKKLIIQSLLLRI